MTTSDLHNFVVRTIPGAVGTMLYALTQLGPVAWITFLWVAIQILRFSLQWYREERKLYLDRKREDEQDKDYP